MQNTMLYECDKFTFRLYMYLNTVTISAYKKAKSNVHIKHFPKM